MLVSEIITSPCSPTVCCVVYSSMQYLCVLWSTSTHQCTHISGAPLLDHGDDVCQFHLQSERCLPLRLHLYVLSHLSHHRVHTLRQTDRQTGSGQETDRLQVQVSVRCVSPGVCYLHTLEQLQKSFKPFKKLYSELIAPLRGTTDEHVPADADADTHTHTHTHTHSWYIN